MFAPNRFRSPLARFAFVPIVTALLAPSGCQFLKRSQSAPQTAPTPKPTPAGPKPPQIDFAAVRPNELGLIPVIMYHEIRGTVNSVPKLTRSVASFQEDLEVLHKAGFYPVNMGDVVENNIQVPPGKSPVVLTFDDARGSQFQLLETANSLQVDPQSAVGVMEAFHKKHGDEWPLRGTFFVLPKSKATLDAFGQTGLGDQKMQYLVDKGFEIGNHSTYHKSMRPMNPAQIQEELGYANNKILEGAPKAQVRVFALPMGKYPRDKNAVQYLLKGEYQGKPYNYKAVMLAAWRPVPSPASKEYNPLKLERIDSVDGTNGIRDWVRKLTTSSSGYERYISDGDPNVVSYPKDKQSAVNVAKLKAQNKLAYAYAPFGGSGGAKPIIGAGDEPTDLKDTSPPGAKPITSAEAPSATIQPAPGPNGAGG